MNLRFACIFLAGLLSLACSAGQTIAAEIHTIAFGSCLRQNKPAPILDTIASSNPDLFIFLGDNIYGDTEDMSVLKEKYGLVAAMSGYQKLRETCPILATWDDHDMGKNDAGIEYPMKQESKQIMLDFFAEPPDSARRKREGVYDVKTFNSEGRKVQVILLDTRWFRSPLKRNPTTRATRYIPDPADEKTVLGPEQWAWLGKTLKDPADLRIIASSIQVISDQHGFEKWNNFPQERERLLELLSKSSGEIVLLSGDRHFASMHAIERNGKSIFDLTSSSLNQAGNPSPGDTDQPLKIAEPFSGTNFGKIRIGWRNEKPKLTFEICDENGKVVRSAGN